MASATALRWVAARGGFCPAAEPQGPGSDPQPPGVLEGELHLAVAKSGGLERPLPNQGLHGPPKSGRTTIAHAGGLQRLDPSISPLPRSTKSGRFSRISQLHSWRRGPGSNRRALQAPSLSALAPGRSVVTSPRTPRRRPSSSPPFHHWHSSGSFEQFMFNPSESQSREIHSACGIGKLSSKPAVQCSDRGRSRKQ